MNAIAKLMRPRSVAVIGASADLAKTSGRPVAYLQKHGFGGQIYPVNPRYETIGGLACYPDVASLLVFTTTLPLSSPMTDLTRAELLAPISAGVEPSGAATLALAFH